MMINKEFDINSYLDNEWLCPYCLAKTQPRNKFCPACKKPLIITSRVNAKPSVWLWRGIFLQISVVLLIFSIGLAWFALSLKAHGIPPPLPFLPLYFGLPVDQPESITQIVLDAFPRRLFWGFLIPLIYSVILIFILYFRVRHGNTIYLVSASLLLAAGVTFIIFLNNTLLMQLIGVLSFLVGAAQLMVTMNLWNDFQFKSGRLRLRIDKGVKNHTSLYLSGRKYADLGMWGLSILHLHRAIARHQRKPIYHLTLAIAYMKVKRFDLAEVPLNNAEKLDPDAPEIWQLRKKLNARKARKKNATT